MLFTDYSYALLYTCRHLGDGGRCLPGASIVAAFSRTDDVPDDIMDHMRALVHGHCQQSDDYFERLLVEGGDIKLSLGETFEN